MERSTRAGLVLVGGRISRMGRDQAVLSVGSRTLVEQTAGIEPPRAVYHVRALPVAESELGRKLLKMQDCFRELDLAILPVNDTKLLWNLNTPAELTTEIQ